MNRLYKQSTHYFFTLIALLISINGYSQCTDCTFTYGNGSSGRVDLNGNQNICITGNSTMSLGNVNGSGNKICIAPGVTWTTSTSMYSGIVIELYGTMKASSLSGNGNMVINVHESGKLDSRDRAYPAISQSITLALSSLLKMAPLQYKQK